MLIARGELGVKELPGAASNPRVEEYQRAAHGREDDEVPWCSSFVCWCMQQAGYPDTNSGAARSWMRWGSPLPLKAPRVGCVVVLWRESIKGYKGHVGLFVREDEHGIWILSGNAGNAVTIKPFPRRRLLGLRWMDAKPIG